MSEKDKSIVPAKNEGEEGKTVTRDDKGRMLPGFTANPSGRPKGRNWSATLAELAETKKRGGGGLTRAETILKKLLDKAETGDLTATALIMDRIDGKAVQSTRIDHTTGGEPLNASISFVEPIKDIDITPPAAENPASS